MNMAIEIRDAVLYEAEHLSELAMRSKAYWGYSDAFLEKCRDELSVQPFDIEDSNFHYSVGILKNEIVGFYAIERLSQSAFELDALFVEPKHIGAGIGSALMDHAKKRVMALGGQVLTIQSDPNAERFYRAAGGVLTGTRESGSIRGRYLPVFEILLNGENAA
jgi:GNAT superfamily N-acetyltransferase